MEEKDRRFIRLMGVLSTVGIAMVASTVIGYLIGRFLDVKFGTSPWLTLVFLVFGVAAGFKNLFDAAKKASRIDDDPGKDPHER